MLTNQQLVNLTPTELGFKFINELNKSIPKDTGLIGFTTINKAKLNGWFDMASLSTYDTLTEYAMSYRADYEELDNGDDKTIVVFSVHEVCRGTGKLLPKAAKNIIVKDDSTIESFKAYLKSIR